MAQTPCSVDACEDDAKVKGWCKPHYMRQYRHGDLNVQRTARQAATCGVEDCDSRPHAKGLCSAHGARKRRHGDAMAEVQPRRRQEGLTCRGPKCDRPAVTRGLCNSHEYQERVIDELSPIREYKVKGGPCEAEGCDGVAKTDGLCQTHYRRKLRGEENWDRLIVRRRPHGEGHVNEDGYRVITVNGRPKLEHRHLFEQLLGRKLLRTETVHHVNGDRANNRVAGSPKARGGRYRSGNLELWSTSQPAGQDVPAKVAWAREILALYGHLVPE